MELCPCPVRARAVRRSVRKRPVRWRLIRRPLAAIVLVSGSAAGFQSGIYNSRGASGALYIQGIVFFRAGHVPVGVGDLVGLGGRL
jgi:hypothetical protein